MDQLNSKPKRARFAEAVGYVLLVVLLSMAGWTMRAAHDLLVNAARLQEQVLHLQKEILQATEARQRLSDRLDDQEE